MPAGSVPCNRLLTPHWVEPGGPAGQGEEGVAASISISPGRLRLDRQLPPAGRAQDRRYRQHPEERF